MLARLCFAILFFGISRAIDLNIDDTQSIKDAASTAAHGMMTWYHGNETGEIPGAFPTKWWEGGAMFMTLLQYWHFTGDETYNDELSVGLQWQSGDAGDYMPANYSSYLGNDDQVFWGLAAMTAAELQFPDRKDGFSWLSLAQGVFNTQIDRWDPTSCGGGLRWQIFTYEAGYNIKNSISNGGLFQLSARLARYTNNSTYSDWAEKIWDWTASTPLLNNQTWNVADTTNLDNECTTQGNEQWSYNYGTFFMGCAYMYKYTNDTKWLTATHGLLNVTLDKFFPAKYGNNTMSEILCEPLEVCNDNEIIFKGLVSSWLAFTSILIPSTYDSIKPKLQGSAQAAAQSCAGLGNNTCGVRWYQKKWDGWNGLEEQLSATNVLFSVLAHPDDSKGPVTSDTGGDSKSDSGAGQSDPSSNKHTLKKITAGDKAGASILTVLFAGLWLGFLGWMLFD